jgi:hypothetical protein
VQFLFTENVELLLTHSETHSEKLDFLFSNSALINNQRAFLINNQVHDVLLNVFHSVFHIIHTIHIIHLSFTSHSFIIHLTLSFTYHSLIIGTYHSFIIHLSFTYNQAVWNKSKAAGGIWDPNDVEGTKGYWNPADYTTVQAKIDEQLAWARDQMKKAGGVGGSAGAAATGAKRDMYSDNTWMLMTGKSRDAFRELQAEWVAIRAGNAGADPPFYYVCDVLEVMFNTGEFALLRKNNSQARAEYELGFPEWCTVGREDKGGNRPSVMHVLPHGITKTAQGVFEVF